MGSAGNEPGDVVSEKTATYTVYGLVDPTIGSMFYVGITRVSPQNRLAAHCADPASSAWRKCRQIISSGARPMAVTLASGLTKPRAKLLESRLIYMLHELVNDRDYGGISISSVFHPEWKNLEYEL
jgi:hypothetical protein